MQLHGNARTTPYQRREMARCVLEQAEQPELRHATQIDGVVGSDYAPLPPVDRPPVVRMRFDDGCQPEVDVSEYPESGVRAQLLPPGGSRVPARR